MRCRKCKVLLRKRLCSYQMAIVKQDEYGGSYLSLLKHFAVYKAFHSTCFICWNDVFKDKVYKRKEVLVAWLSKGSFLRMTHVWLKDVKEDVSSAYIHADLKV